MGEDREDFETRSAVDIVSQSITNLGVSIQDQVQDLNVKIQDQVSDLTVDVAAQTINELDINFSGQTDGVQTDKEFSARVGSTEITSGQALVSNNSTADLAVVNASSPFLIEQAAGSQTQGFDDGATYSLVFDFTGDGIADEEVAHDAPAMPMDFDPAIRVPQSGTAKITVRNDTGSQKIFFGNLIFRFV